MEFERLLKIHTPRLRYLSRKYTHNNYDNAQDLMQETLIKAFIAFKDFVPEKEYSFLPWISKIMLNISLDKHKSNKEKWRTNMHSIDFRGNRDYSPVDHIEQSCYGNADKIMETKQIIDHIKSMSGLAPQALLMQIDGYSIKEIIKKIYKNESAVKKDISQTRKKIIKKFAHF